MDNQKMLGCSVPFHPPIERVSSHQDVEICNNSTLGKLAFDGYRNSIQTNILDQIPCAGFYIFLGLPSIDVDGNDPKQAYIRLFIKPKIKVKSIVLYYDEATLLGDIGGYVGMFLGVSLVDLAVFCNSGFLKLVKRKF